MATKAVRRPTNRPERSYEDFQKLFASIGQLEDALRNPVDSPPSSMNPQISKQKAFGNAYNAPQKSNAAHKGNAYNAPQKSNHAHKGNAT
ncbi:hypothetical protein DVH24_014143 [Malus domestica]|uniref:Uncharacterized protein n=1 Tax=Malus domestica TaxID=3750 RepID=A0A498JFJ4_MALDO|nr:hypothetical protein DVH24_014143 [Malus domestica]